MADLEKVTSPKTIPIIEFFRKVPKLVFLGTGFLLGYWFNVNN